MEKTKSKKKIIIIVLCAVVALLIAGDWILTVIVYNENFGQRFETYEPLMMYLDDFDGLQRTRYEFTWAKARWLYVQCRRESARHYRNGARLRRRRAQFLYGLCELFCP